MAASDPDAVYMLHWPGWAYEAVSNRWHYARRWLEHVPVVMVVPDLPPDQPAYRTPDGRIEGLEVLHVTAVPANREYLLRWASYQAEAVVQHMDTRRHERPLIWQYNPYLLLVSCLVPAVGRVYHATDNFLDMATDMPGSWPDADLLRGLVLATVDVSDVVIGCSTGVSERLAAASGRADLVTVTNGCDYAAYAEPGPSPPDLVEALRPLSRYERRAIFAGNINSRMDFALMRETARRLPETAFVYVGRVSEFGLEPAAAQAWADLQLLPNVVILGSQDVDRLAALYGWATVGIIPYRCQPHLVHNGFPLKALEMAATGLPVVSTPMDPLRAVHPAVEVTDSGESFVEAVARADRGKVSPETAAEVSAICRAHDYSRLFVQAHDASLTGVHDGPPALAGLDPVQKRLGAARLLGSAPPSVRRAEARADGSGVGRALAVLPLPAAVRVRAVSAARALRPRAGARGRRARPRPDA